MGTLTIKKIGCGEAITDLRLIIDGLSAPDAVQLHNNYCEAVDNEDGRIFYLDDWFADELPQLSPEQAFTLGLAARYCEIDTFLTYDGDGNVKTTDDPRARGAGWIYSADIAREILTRWDDFGCEQIREYLDGIRITNF